MTQFIAFAITAILAFAYHEFAHAIVADRLGDPTPRSFGRITPNPFVHLSLSGLAFLFIIGFGWAVTPVNPNRLRGNPRRSMAIVAVAGPLANLAMAILYALPLRFGLVSAAEFGTVVPTPWELLTMGLRINLLLFVFNLMPIPPLDGFTILQGLLPPDLAYQLDGLRQYGTMILLGVLIVLPLIGFDVFGVVILPLMSQLAALLVGVG
ncbi:MAG: site-2 protease family protein [Chloroflexota bacterium]|nr:MAG: site-2 protease family protein [Chloroflexota bacterium]